MSADRTWTKGSTALRDEIASLHPAAFAWALSCCGRNREAAQEVLQDSYAKIIDGSAKFHGNSSLKTWLFGVIRFTALEHRRRSALGWLRLTRFQDQQHRRTSAVPDESAQMSERVNALHHSLQALGRRQREVLHLVFYEGLSVEEAARAMGVSIGTARTHYHRGKRKLLGLLKKEGIDP